MKKQDSDMTTAEKKCLYCGKDFIPKDNQKFCTTECYLEYNAKKTRLKTAIKRIAKKYDFEIENLSKIVNAKMLLFKHDNLKRCPCDANNAKRFCGSAQCIADVVYKGHCHCNLFHLKNDSNNV